MEVLATAVDGREPGSPAMTACSARWELRSHPTLAVASRARPLGNGIRYDMVLRNEGPDPVAVDQVRLRLLARPSRVLEHGYQSWSPVAPEGVSRIRPWRRHAPGWPRGTWFAAPALAGRAVVGDQFLVCADGCGTGGSEGGVAGFLDGAEHLSTVVSGPDGLWVAAWLDGVVIDPGAERQLDPLWTACGDPGPLYSEYAAHWSAVAGGRTQGPSPLGWCTWYQYFWKITPEIVRQNLRTGSARGIEVFQIDDGYAAAVGDWLTPKSSWSQGDPSHHGQIGALASEIRDAGATPGIWTAPFLASPQSDVFRSHPDWLVRAERPRRRRSDAVPLGAIWNPVTWGGWVHPLDTSLPEVLDHLRGTYRRLVELGYTYHKIDFCYAASLPGRRFADGRVTRAQALRAGLQAVRDGIGEGSFLLGCGCPLAQAVGVVDAMRVSPDTAPYWLPLLHVPGYPDTAPSARNAVRASVLRAPLHRRLWINDPDCLLLRPVRTRLAASRRSMIADVVAGTGGFTVLSDDLSTYSDREWDAVTRLRAAMAASDTVLDIEDPFASAPAVTSRSPAGASRAASGGHEASRLEVSWARRAPWASWAPAPGPAPSPAG